MLLKIYLVFCLIIFLLYEMCICEITQEAKRKYKDIVLNNIEKKSFLETLCAQIRMFIISFIPIINLSMFYSVLFQSNKIKNFTFNEIDRRIQQDIKNNK